MVSEHGGARFALARVQQQRLEVVAVEDVVAQHQRRSVVANEGLADGECLSQAIRAWLHGVGQVQAPLAAVA